MTRTFRRALRRQICVNVSGLALGAVIASLLAVGVWHDQETRRALQPPPPVIRYQTWQPVRYWYAPGEDVFFSVNREAFIAPGTRVGLRVTTSWQDAAGSGLTYPAGPVLAHHVKTPGPRTLLTVRSLPANLPPGSWRLVGTAESVAETAVRSVSLFESEAFTVGTP